METRKLRIMVTGEDCNQFIQHILRECDNCIYSLVDRDNNVIDVSADQQMRTRHSSDKRLSLSTADGVSVSKKVQGYYEVSISTFSDWNKLQHETNFDAIVIVTPSSKREYVNDYLTHALTYSKVLFVIVHTRFDYNSAPHVKSDMVSAVRDRVQQEREEQELSRRVYSNLPAHIFVDLNYDTNFPYREYLTKHALQQMLNTIWTLKPNKVHKGLLS